MLLRLITNNFNLYFLAQRHLLHLKHVVCCKLKTFIKFEFIIEQADHLFKLKYVYDEVQGDQFSSTNFEYSLHFIVTE